MHPIGSVAGSHICFVMPRSRASCTSPLSKVPAPVSNRYIFPATVESFGLNASIIAASSLDSPIISSSSGEHDTFIALYTAFSDNSTSSTYVGNVSSPTGKSTVIIRTDFGKEVFEGALERGYIEARPIEKSGADLIRRLMKEKKEAGIAEKERRKKLMEQLKYSEGSKK